MNPLAGELNSILDQTVAGRLLSEFGRSLYFPKGIVAQTAEANKRAHRFNATVGMAYEDGEPIMLSGIKSIVTGLSPTETVAYAPTPGVPELRATWKREMVRKNPSLEGVPTTEPMVTSGLTNGLLQVAEMFVDEGDAVVLPEMFWGNYRLVFELRRRAQLITFPLYDEQGRFNVAGLAKALQGHRKAVVLLNFPNNPTGYTPTKTEAAQITAALSAHADAGNDLLVAFDDAYFGLFYDDSLMEESLFVPCSTAHKRLMAVKIDGATKEDFAWGFRIGFVTFAGLGLKPVHLAALERKLMGSIRATVSNSSRVAQSMLLKGLESESYAQEKAERRAMLKSRFTKVREIVESVDTSPLVPLPFNSGYFMSFDCSGVNAEDLRLALLDKGIGTISIQERYLRVAYSTVDERDLEELYAEIVKEARRLAS